MAEMDKFRIDSHKLIYHIERIQGWLKGKNIYPIYIEIGLYGACNHRCIFCAFDFLNYKPDIFDLSCLKKFICVARKKGVKSILYSGEGEPLLHKDAASIIRFTKKSDIDVALVTNGVLLDREKSRGVLPYLTWLKVSLDAGSRKTYGLIHGTRGEDFHTVINNLKEAIKIRNKHKYDCAIGGQLLLMRENHKEAVILAQLLSNLGADYLVIKPYCQHPSSKHRIKHNLKDENLIYLEEGLAKYSKNNFQVIFRRNAMGKVNAARPYKYCLGLPFAAHITARGDVYPCNVFLGKKEFIFGNICKGSFKNIWEGKRRSKIMSVIRNKWDIANCREACRLDEINRYLWELNNPVSHVNFI